MQEQPESSARSDQEKIQNSAANIEEVALKQVKNKYKGVQDRFEQVKYMTKSKFDKINKNQLKK